MCLVFVEKHIKTIFKPTVDMGLNIEKLENYAHIFNP